MSKWNRTLRRLALGTILAIVAICQAVAQQELHITISRIAGTVEVQNASATKGQWVAAKKDQVIGMGWNLRTGATSKVQLVFPKDNVVILKENSVLTVDKLDAGGGAVLNAKSGGLLADIKNALSPGSEFDVKTPNALAVVRGTKFAVEIKPQPHISGGGGGVSMNFMMSGKPMPILYLNPDFSVLLGGGGGKAVSGDVDGDGKDEVILPGTTAAKLMPAIQKIRQAKARMSSPGGGMPAVKFSDVNGDGRQDIVISLPTGQSDAAGLPEVNDEVLLNAGDLDNDGKPDYIVEGGMDSAGPLEDLALRGKIKETNPAKDQLEEKPRNRPSGDGDATEITPHGTAAQDEIGDARDYQREPGKIDAPGNPDANLVSGRDLLDLQQAAGDGSVRVAKGDVNGDGIDDVTLNFTRKAAGDGSVKLLGVGDVDGDSLPDYIYQHNQTDMDFVRRLYSDLLGRDPGTGAVVGHDVTSPRDPASGQATGRQAGGDDNSGAVNGQYKQFLGRDTGGATGDSSEVKSPRDIASGMPTGKRMHKPITITAEVGKSDGLVSGEPVRKWIESSLQMNFLRKSGELQAADFKRDIRQVREFRDALLTEADLNGDGKTDLTIKFGTGLGRTDVSGVNAKGNGGGAGSGKVKFDEFYLLAVADADGDGVGDFAVKGGEPTAQQFQNMIDSSLNYMDDQAARGDGSSDATPDGTRASDGRSYVSGHFALRQGDDVNGDGKPDVVVSGGELPDALRKSGELQAADFKRTSSGGGGGAGKTGDTKHDNLGKINVAAADVNGDGRANLHIKFTPISDEAGRRANLKHTDLLLIATGDVNGDGVPDYILPGGDAEGNDLGILIGLLLPAVQRIDDAGDGAADHVITGGGMGAGPHVKIAGDQDVLTGAGAGGGPHVKRGDAIVSGQDLAPVLKAGEAGPIKWMAPESLNKRGSGGGGGAGKNNEGDGSVRVAVGDVNGDGISDVTLNFTRKAGGGATVKLLGAEDLDRDLWPDYILEGGGANSAQLNSILIGLLVPAVEPADSAERKVTVKGWNPETKEGIASDNGGGSANNITPRNRADLGGTAVGTTPSGASGKTVVSGKKIQSWIQNSYDKGYIRKSGAITAADFNYRTTGGSLITARVDKLPRSWDGSDQLKLTIAVMDAAAQREPTKHPAKVTVPDIRIVADQDGDGVGEIEVDPAGAALLEELISSTPVSGGAVDHEIKSPRDLATGQASGKVIVSGKQIQSWIKASFDKGYIRKSGQITHADFNLRTSSGSMITARVDKLPRSWDGTDQLQLTIAVEDAAAQREPTKHPAKVTVPDIRIVADQDGDGVGEIEVDASGAALLEALISSTPVGGDGAANHEIKSPRDLATGQASGKSAGSGGGNASPLYDAQGLEVQNPLYQGGGHAGQNPLSENKRTTNGILTAAEWAQLQAADKALADRDAASGQATGKSAAPRDPATGLATGKRMHKPFVVTAGDVDGDGSVDLTVQLEMAYSSEATRKLPGRTKYPNIVLKAVADTDGDGKADYSGTPEDIETLRSYAAGHFELDMDNTVVSPRDPASGLPTGKRLGIGDQSPTFPAGFVSGGKMRDWIKNSYDGKDAKTLGGVRVATGDVNGDGRADLTISFTPPPPGQTVPESRKGLNAVNVKLAAIDDQDGDGIADFVIASGDEGTLNVLIGLLLPAVAPADKNFTTDPYVEDSQRHADVNGDGQPDVIVSGQRAEELRKAGEAAGHGGSGFTGGVRVATGDVTGDGKANLTLNFTPSAADSKKGLNAVNVKLARMADVNGDGTPDFMLVGGASSEGALNALIGLLLPAVQKIDDTDGATNRDIITGAGAGGGPHVKRGEGILTGAEWTKLQAADTALAAPRDAASGQATGRRQHKPFLTTTGDVDGDGSVDLTVQLELADAAPRDVATGQASGKRAGKAKYKNIVLKRIADTDGDGLADYSGDPADIEALRSYSAGHFELLTDADAGSTLGRTGPGGGPHVKRGDVVISGKDLAPVLAAGKTIPIKWMAPESLNKRSAGGNDAEADGSVRVATGDVNGDGYEDVTLNFTRNGQGGVVIVLDGAGDLDADGVMDYVPAGGDSDGPKIDSILIGLLLPAVQKGKDGSVRGREAGPGGGDTGFNQTHNQEGKGRQNGLAGGGGGSGSPAGLAIDEAGTGKSHPKPKNGISLGDLNGDGEDEYAVPVGDIDQDGLPDYIVAFSSGPRQTTSQDGTFSHGTSQRSIKAGHYAVSNFHTEIDGKAAVAVAAGDLDGDGFDDFVVGSNTGDGSVRSPRDPASGQASGRAQFNPKELTIDKVVQATGDIDGDGIPDSLTGVVVADMDGDGLADIVISGHQGGGAASGRVNKIDSFTIKQGIKADLDGDGVIDALDNDSDGDGKANYAVGDLDGDGSVEHAFQGQDVDGDGKPDYVILSGFSHGGGSSADRKAAHDIAMNSIRNLKGRLAGGNGNGGPAGMAIDEGGTPKVHHKPGLALTGDLDGDGSPDFIISGEEVQSFTVTNTGTATTGTLRVAKGDVNGDGKSDVTLNFSKKGDNGQLLPAVQYVLVAAADLDGDGKPDFLFHGSQSDADQINALIGLLLPAVQKIDDAGGTTDRGIIAAGAGGGPHVKRGDVVVSGQTVKLLVHATDAAGNTGADRARADEYVRNYGFRVEMADVNGDGSDDVKLNFTLPAAGKTTPPAGGKFDGPSYAITLTGAGDVDGDGTPDFSGSPKDVDTVNILIGLLLPAVQRLDDRNLLGLKTYDPLKQYQPGDTVVYNGKELKQYFETGDKPTQGQFRTKSSAGTVDPTPATYTWRVDTTPPDTTRTSGGGGGAGGLHIVFQHVGESEHEVTLSSVADTDGDGSPDYKFEGGDIEAFGILIGLLRSGEIVSPRDHASGLPTGKRQYDPVTVKNDPGFLSGAEWAQIQAQNQVQTAREASSGMATGRRQYKPLKINFAGVDNDLITDLTVTIEEADDSSIMSPRDHASGLPTGQRMHKPIFYGVGDVDGDGSPDFLGTPEDLALLRSVNEAKPQAPRDAASGQATGRRQYNPVTVTKDPGFLSSSEWTTLQAQDNAVTSPRDVASGMPTGKRMHKPLTIRMADVDGDGSVDLELNFETEDSAIVSPRDAASGLPTGKRMHKPIFYGIGDVNGDGSPDFLGEPQDLADVRAYVTSPRDVASGLPTGKSVPAGNGAGDTFFGFNGKVEITNDKGTSYLTPDTTIEVSPGGAPGAPGTSGPDAEKFLKDIEDPALFDQADAAAAAIKANLAPIRQRLQKMDRDLKQIETEWPKYERTHDLGRLIILWSEALKMRPELDKVDGDIWHVLDNQSKPLKQYDPMVTWMQQHGVPDVDIPELLKNMRERIDELELDIAPFIKGNQQLLDQLQGLLDQGNPALGLRGDLIDTDNDGVGDATEITLGTDPLHNNGNEGFIKLDSPDDRESFDIATDKSIDFSFEPLDTDVKLTYALVLDSGGKESVRHNAKDTERFDMASLIGPQGLFTDVIGPGGVLTVSWHVEAQLPALLGRSGGKLPQIKSATRTFTIQTPSNQLVEVNLAAAAASTKLGSPVLVNGSITDVIGLSDWEIVINYDPALLTFSQGVKRGLFSKSTVFFNDSRGQLTVSGSVPKGSAGITGNGDIFQLTFTPVLPGRSEVAVKRVTLHDVLGKPIQAQGGDVADIGVTASSTGAGGGGVSPQLPPAPGVTTAPQSSGDSAGLPSLGPLTLVSPRNGDSLDYPGGKELAFEYTELRTKFDVTYTLYMRAGGAQASKRNYVSGDPMPLATLLGKSGPFANSMGPNGVDIDWYIEAAVDTGGAPVKIQSETRRLSIKLPTNKSVTLDLSAARGKSRGIAVGDSVFVRGSLSSVNALGEWQMTITFDSSVLSFVNGRKMGMFATGNVRIDSQGMGRVVISGTSPGAGLSGDGDCFELEFTAKGDGTCTIEADAPKLTDAMGRSIPGNSGGSVDVDVVAKGGGNSGGNTGIPGKP